MAREYFWIVWWIKTLLPESNEQEVVKDRMMGKIVKSTAILLLELITQVMAAPVLFDCNVEKQLLTKFITSFN